MRRTAILAAIFSTAISVVANFAFAASDAPEIGRCAQAHQSGDGSAIAKYCQFAQYFGEHRRSRDYGPGAPTGSFVESCRNTQQRGWMVYSDCRDRRGNWSRTSVNFQSCPDFSLSNLNGNLVCGP